MYFFVFLSYNNMVRYDLLYHLFCSKEYIMRAYRNRYRPSRRVRTIRNRAVIITASVLTLAVLAGGIYAVGNMLQKETPKTGQEGNGQTGQASAAAPSQNVSIAPQPAALTRDTNFGGWNQEADWQLIVVNASNPVPDNWEVQPDDTTYENITVDKRILEDLQAMIAAARKDGISLWISSAYRSKSRQAQLLEQEIKSHEQKGLTSSEAAVQAVRLVMPAGYSEHQTGLAIDFNGVQEDFYSTDAYAWLDKHAADYGFIERYPQDKVAITGIDFEPWHYRYVGQEAAKEIASQGMCLEEYIYAQMQEK